MMSWCYAIFRTWLSVLCWLRQALCRCAHDFIICTQEINDEARSICSAEAAPMHWALMRANMQEPLSIIYHSILLSLWAVACTVHHQSTLSDEEQVAFLADAGIVAIQSSSAQHTVLRPSRKRKSHKHRRWKSHKKSRNSREATPSSGEESLSDSGLGIMTPDADDTAPQATASWLLDTGRPGLSSVHTSANNLPAVLLHHAISDWIEYCCI